MDKLEEWYWKSNVYVDASKRHTRIRLHYEGDYHSRFGTYESIETVLRCHEILTQVMNYCDGKIKKPTGTVLPPLLRRTYHALLVEAYMAASHIKVHMGNVEGTAVVGLDFFVPSETNPTSAAYLGCRFIFLVDCYGHVTHTVPWMYEGYEKWKASVPQGRLAWMIPPFVTQKQAA